MAGKLGDRNIAIVDMSDAPQYQRFHLPGAIQLPYSLINQHSRRRVSLSIGSEKIAFLLGKLGISKNTHVVIYDDMGGINAGRLFWELERLGHKKVSVLDGGLVKWILEGRKVTNSTLPRKPVSYRTTMGARSDRQASLAEVTANLDKPEFKLIDVRTKEEYAGNPKQVRSGHIPGARWWAWDSSVDFENEFVLKKKSRLLGQLSAIGIKDKSAPLILYCRTAHRASQSYMVLRELGFENVKVYDGSMAEYYQQKNLPLEKGLPKRP